MSFGADDGLMDRLYREDPTYDSYLEYIAELQSDTRRAAELQYELQTQGPIYDLLVAARKDAVEALKMIVRADPGDAATISALQARVRNFRVISEFIIARIEAGKAADRQIQEEFSDE